MKLNQFDSVFFICDNKKIDFFVLTLKREKKETHIKLETELTFSRQN